MVKLPTAKDDEEGVGTGETDFLFDFIASKEINQRVELSGYGGFIFRGDPDEVNLSDGFRWGLRRRVPDTQEPARSPQSCTASRSSTMWSTRASATLVGEDGSLPPLVSDADTRRTSRSA